MQLRRRKKRPSDWKFQILSLIESQGFVSAAEVGKIFNATGADAVVRARVGGLKLVTTGYLPRVNSRGRPPKKYGLATEKVTTNVCPARPALALAELMQIEQIAQAYGLSADQLAGLVATQSPDKGTEHGAGDINPKGLKGS